MKNILVTGGAGFIGSNYIQYLFQQYPEANIVNVDLMTRAENYHNIMGFEGWPNYHFIRADIRDRRKMVEIFENYDIDTVVNFAVESDAGRGITNSQLFFSTNVLGVQSLLDAAVYYWKEDLTSKVDRRFRPGVKFLQVSTDQVYGTLTEDGYFTEATSPQPNTPYSSSKKSADNLVMAYFHTYGLPINITRCGNNYGMSQSGKAPLHQMIIQAVKGRKLPIYSEDLQVRDWLHVNDHCRGIDFVIQKGADGEVYNIGGGNEKTNLEIAQLILFCMNRSLESIEFVVDCPDKMGRSVIDNTKITSELGWKPLIVFEEGIQQVIHHYWNPVLKFS